MQGVVNDPIRLLQQDIDHLVVEGYTFDTTVINIATQPKSPSSRFLTARQEVQP
jgi:hypothetical protein